MKTKFLLVAILLAFTFTSCEKDEILDNTLTEQTRDPDGCETAFAYEKDQCFYEYGFKRWGWLIGPISEPYNDIHDLYAGAGKCKKTNGELVGYISINYMDDYVEVEYHMTGDYGLIETHLYVGNNMFPQLPNGNNTVAPGKYGNQSSHPEGTDYASYKIDDVSGDLYIIAHAVVCPKKDDTPN